MAKVRLGWLLAGIVAVAGCAKQAGAIPAFARKYNLPCSACHEAWPKLNNFGQVFRDNGFQLMNDRDSPIYQSPSYWPIMFRTTPQWHHETNTGVPIDNTPGNAGSGQHEATVKTSGFDFTGVDIHRRHAVQEHLFCGAAFSGQHRALSPGVGVCSL